MIQPRPIQTEPQPVRRPRPPERRWPRIGLIVAGAAILALAYWVHGRQRTAPPAGGEPIAMQRAAVPVVATTTRQGDMPVYLNGLGSVIGFNTVTVKSRVDGQLVTVAFQEGQFVREGDLLAEVDPRPFQVQLEQAEGQLARDQAQLDDARRTLVRYRDLRRDGVISQQELDDQVARSGQFEGAIKADQAMIDSARLQLTYARITAPISGRVGLRRVDVGNIVHATDQNGVVVIAQLQPIAVVFTLPEDSLPPVMQKLTGGQHLTVEAYDRADQKRIASGELLTVDNQIDQSTGTVRLKAVFPNDDDALFPNQFVNAHLLLDVKHGAIIAPVAAIQRGAKGTYVYVVKPDHTVETRPVTVGPTGRTEAAIESGLAADETVVVEGVDKLRDGTTVQVRAPERNGTPAANPAA
jgi:membrane fusion protein, multidrug efflux system